LFVLGQGALCTVVYAERVADLAKKVSDKKPSKMDEEAEEEGEKEVRMCVFMVHFCTLCVDIRNIFYL
jgi:hypothetical protein